MKKLKTLDKHNSDARKFHHNANDNKPRLNGIACPKCGKELLDSHPNITLTSYPPQKNVKCSECDYVGYRVC